MHDTRTTRLAPSPTGALHLGNARTFLINWLLARQNGWRIVLRIEDLDGPRIKRGAGRQLIDDLNWLGLDWDEGPLYQSSRLTLYQRAIERLIGDGKAYPCVCSRKEVAAAASAPHAEDGAAVYPGTCRGKFDSPAAAQAATGRPPALRFQVPDEVVEFHDRFAGPQRFDVARQHGDFVIAKSFAAQPVAADFDELSGVVPHPLCVPAYQLAAVVDDAEMGITDVVRGDDLLDSTPRQIMLYRALGLEKCIPNYWHVPLVVGADGRRLAKRHGDTRLSGYRDRGVSAARVVALLARWCGIENAPAYPSPRDLLQSFRLEQVSRDPIIFTPADDRRLLSGGT